MPTLAERVCGLRCVLCAAESPLADGVYVCAACGGNLQVTYDYDAVGRALTRETLAVDDDHTMWRYAPLYPVERRFDYPAIGWSPLFQAPRLAERLGVGELWVKDDGRNPSASFKDRASSVALLRAVETGHELVTGASTGNAASSTAVLAAALGVRTRIFIPAAAPRASNP